jgi:hypothetical protein
VRAGLICGPCRCAARRATGGPRERLSPALTPGQRRRRRRLDLRTAQFGNALQVLQVLRELPYCCRLARLVLRRYGLAVSAGSPAPGECVPSKDRPLAILFAGLAALGRRPRPGRPTGRRALGCPSGSAWPTRRPSASSCAAARPSRTSSRFEFARPVTSSCSTPCEAIRAECQNRRWPPRGGLAHRLVAGFVKIVVYSIGVFSDYGR